MASQGLFQLWDGSWKFVSFMGYSMGPWYTVRKFLIAFAEKIPVPSQTLFATKNKNGYRILWLPFNESIVHEIDLPQGDKYAKWGRQYFDFNWFWENHTLNSNGIDPYKHLVR